MELKARIINREAVEVIDMTYEQAKVDLRLANAKDIAGLTAEYITEIQAKNPEERSEAENTSLELLASIEAAYELETVRLSTYLPFTESDPPEISELDTALPYYEESEGAVTRLWETTVNDPTKIEAKINSLKSELASTDYQVIKNYEYAMAGITCEYDPQTLYSTRIAIRNQINSLLTLES